ncbi:MAG: signal peptidase II [Bifidobacteriaceae bacterium]|nr:signal peptidase II [Bifidobacteriaceae bacterium]
MTQASTDGSGAPEQSGGWADEVFSGFDGANAQEATADQPAAARLDADADSGPPAPTRLVLLLVTAGVTLALDQITKFIAVRALSGGGATELLPGWLELRLVRNPGAAFSMGESLTVVFTVLAAAVLVAVALVAKRLRSRAWAFTLGLLVAGAAGNLADRLFQPPGFGRGHVVDFIDYGGRFVGNVADIAIVGAMVLMMICVLRGVTLEAKAP